MVSTFTRRPLRAQGAANTSMMMVKQRSSDFDYSCTSLETEDTSFSALGDSSHTLLLSSEADTRSTLSQQRSPSRVRFAQSKDGQVQCEYHELENVVNPALWWQGDEIAQIRQDVSAWVTTHETKTRAILKSTTKFLSLHDNARAARRLLMQMSACPDARGLELAQGTASAAASTHVKAVLEAQSQVQGSSSSSKRLRRVSKKMSKPARELALTKAQHDRKEALKASLTAWQ